MMAYFHCDEENTMTRLRVLQQIVAEQTFHGEPCPLLDSQLKDAQVIGEKFLVEVRAMQKHMLRCKS